MDVYDGYLSFLAPPNTPKILYKYHSFDPSNYHIRLITDREIFFTSARNFNDPFDTSIVYSIENVSAKTILKGAESFFKDEYPHLNRRQRKELAKEKTKAIMRDPNHKRVFIDTVTEIHYNKFGLYCMSEIRDSLLMWAHYSDSHRGFCVGLHTEKLLETAAAAALESKFISLKKIRYEEKMPIIHFFESDDSKGPSDDIDTFISTKSSDWSYEKEYRLVNHNHPDTILQLPPDTISEVIVGCRASEKDRSMITDHVAQLENVILYQAKRHDYKFELDFVRVL